MKSLSPSPARADAPLGLMFTLAALIAVTSLSTDIYLPAMPQMQRDLHGNAELTITGFWSASPWGS